MTWHCTLKHPVRTLTGIVLLAAAVGLLYRHGLPATTAQAVLVGGLAVIGALLTDYEDLGPLLTTLVKAVVSALPFAKKSAE